MTTISIDNRAPNQRKPQFIGISVKVLKNTQIFFAFKLSDGVCTMLINVKMPTI